MIHVYTGRAQVIQCIKQQMAKRNATQGQELVKALSLLCFTYGRYTLHYLSDFTARLREMIVKMYRKLPNSNTTTVAVNASLRLKPIIESSVSHPEEWLMRKHRISALLVCILS